MSLWDPDFVWPDTHPPLYGGGGGSEGGGASGEWAPDLPPVPHDTCQALTLNYEGMKAAAQPYLGGTFYVPQYPDPAGDHSYPFPDGIRRLFLGHIWLYGARAHTWKIDGDDRVFISVAGQGNAWPLSYDSTVCYGTTSQYDKLPYVLEKCPPDLLLLYLPENYSNHRQIPNLQWIKPGTGGGWEEWNDYFESRTGGPAFDDPCALYCGGDISVCQYVCPSIPITIPVAPPIFIKTSPSVLQQENLVALQWLSALAGIKKQQKERQS